MKGFKNTLFIKTLEKKHSKGKYVTLRNIGSSNSGIYGS